MGPQRVTFQALHAQNDWKTCPCKLTQLEPIMYNIFRKLIFYVSFNCKPWSISLGFIIHSGIFFLSSFQKLLFYNFLTISLYIFNSHIFLHSSLPRINLLFLLQWFVGILKCHKKFLIIGNHIIHFL